MAGPIFEMRSFILSELFETLSSLPRVIQQVTVKLHLDWAGSQSPEWAERGACSRKVEGPPSLPKPREAVRMENNGFIKDPTAWLLSPYQAWSLPCQTPSEGESQPDPHLHPDPEPDPGHGLSSGDSGKMRLKGPGRPCLCLRYAMHPLTRA